MARLDFDQFTRGVLACHPTTLPSAVYERHALYGLHFASDTRCPIIPLQQPSRYLSNPSRIYIDALRRTVPGKALLNFQLMSLDTATVKASRDVFRVAGVCVVSTHAADS